MLEWFMKTGPMGLLILPVTMLLVVLTFGVAIGNRKRVMVAVLIALAFIPLLMGLVGTALGFARIDSVVNAYPGEASAEDIAQGESHAMQVTWLGGGATLVLLLFALGLLAVGETGEREV